MTASTKLRLAPKRTFVVLDCTALRCTIVEVLIEDYSSGLEESSRDRGACWPVKHSASRTTLLPYGGWDLYNSSLSFVI